MDSTIVALFEQTGPADAVRQDLLDAGFSRREVGLFVEAPQPQGGGDLSTWFTNAPRDRECSFVSVHGDSDRVRKAAKIIRQHNPLEVKKHPDHETPAQRQTSPRSYN